MAYGRRGARPNFNLTFVCCRSSLLLTTITCAAVFFFFFCRAERVNLAAHKPTRQSLTHNFHTADYAVDGNRDTNFMGGLSCTHTRGDDPHWWYVDLEDEYVITSVVVFNSDKQPERLSNFTVEISVLSPESLPGYPGLTGSPVCVQVEAGSHPAANEEWHGDCSQPIRGRYVRLVKYGFGALVICEFEVYSTTAAVTTTTEPPFHDLDLTRNASDVSSGLRCARLCVTNHDHVAGGLGCRLIRYQAHSKSCQMVHSAGSPAGQVSQEDDEGPVAATVWAVYQTVDSGNRRLVSLVRVKAGPGFA